MIFFKIFFGFMIATFIISWGIAFFRKDSIPKDKRTFIERVRDRKKAWENMSYGP